MKGKSVLMVLAASALGVYGGLQADRWLSGNRPSVLSGKSPALSLTPASLTTESEAAPIQGAPDFRSAARQVLPSVVSVTQFAVMRTWSQETVEQQVGEGSGVILSADGIVVTNNHVIATPMRGGRLGPPATDIKVRLVDGRLLDAKVLGADPRSDLAVLKIAPGNLKPIQIGDSNRLEVGQWVLAVGNPLGFNNTLSAGVVSSLGRSLDVQNLYLTDAIQTDAAINPGNSGGALTDAQGRLVGINSAIASRGGDNAGIAFAIPVSRMRFVVDEILKQGYVRYAALGISYDPRFDVLLQSPDVRRDLTRELGAEPPRQGVMVGSVGDGSAAAGAGLKPFDIILAIGDTEIRNTTDLNSVLNRARPGERTTIQFWSRGQTRRVPVVYQVIESGRVPR